jgi:hypothetical protein
MPNFKFDSYYSKSDASASRGGADGSGALGALIRNSTSRVLHFEAQIWPVRLRASGKSKSFTPDLL